MDKDKDWKKNSALFLASQNTSLFGSMLVQYAITWHITLSTRSGTMMTVSIICFFLPMFLLSPFAGVWADRYDRKLLIILSDSLIAMATLIVAVLFVTGYGSIWLLFAASAVRAMGSAIQTPAIGAFIPQFVPEDKLARVNATNSAIQSLVTLVAPMLSGALMTLAAIESIFFIDVVTAAIAVFILMFLLHVPVHEKAMKKQATSYFGDLLEGARYIRHHSYLRMFFLFSVCFFILIAPAAFLTPLQVTRSFGGDVWRLTALEVAFSVGMMMGGVLMVYWRGFENGVHTMILSLLVNGIAVLALGLTSVFWAYLAFMALIGLVIPAFNTPATVLLQRKVEEAFLGRVFGVMSMISSSMMPLGMLVFGPLADLIRVEWLLVGTGISMAAQSLLMMRSKALIEGGKLVAAG